MTILKIFSEDGGQLSETRLREQIAEQLAALGIRYELWRTDVRFAPGDGPDEVLRAYRGDVERLCDEGGYRLVDVMQLNPDEADPQWPAKAEAARGKFLKEHVHGEDEIRFFVEGSGCFYLHLHGQVYAVVCEAGDLLGVPAGTRHWFDMGRVPSFRVIRFFQEEDGWLAEFTGDPVCEAIPQFDELLAAA